MEITIIVYRGYALVTEEDVMDIISLLAGFES